MLLRKLCYFVTSVTVTITVQSIVCSATYADAKYTGNDVQLNSREIKLAQNPSASIGNEMPPPPDEAVNDGSVQTTTPSNTTPAAPSEASPTITPPVETTNQPTTGGGKQLLLPDISVIGTFIGHTGNDKRDGDRDRLKLDSLELALQSYIYPGMKAEAFVVSDDSGTHVEEGYVTVQNLGVKGIPLTAVVGRRKVPFGRVNQLHNHSWLYIVQPKVLSNMVASESLVGDGAYLSYLFPTKTFLQLDAGFWTAADQPVFDTQDPSVSVVTSPGSGIADKFHTLRVWTANEIFGGTLELGGSYAHGDGGSYTNIDGNMISPTVTLSGADLTYRREGLNAQRFLLRSEFVQHHQSGNGYSKTVNGYYVFADQRLDTEREIGIRYDWSGFPYAPQYHESAVSLIGTKRLTEQTYLRLQLISGKRPGKDNYQEAWFQWVWGFGPHTHNLE